MSHYATAGAVRRGCGCWCVCVVALTSALELLFGGDWHLYCRLSLDRTLYVLHVRHCLHRLVHRHGHWSGHRGGHADYDVECAAAMLPAAPVLAAALYDGGWKEGRVPESGVRNMLIRWVLLGD